MESPGLIERTPLRRAVEAAIRAMPIARVDALRAAISCDADANAEVPAGYSEVQLGTVRRRWTFRL